MSTTHMQRRRRLATRCTRLPLKLREEIEAKVREGGVSCEELFRLVRSRQPDADIGRSTFRHHLSCYRADQVDPDELKNEQKHPEAEGE